MREMQEKTLKSRIADVPEVRNFVSGDLDSAPGPGKPSERAHAQVGLLQPSACLSVCMTCSWCTWPQINSGKLVYLAGSDSLWSLSRLQTGPRATHTSHPTSTTNELEFNLKDLGRQSGSKGELGEE